MKLSSVIDALMVFTDGSRLAAAQSRNAEGEITAWYWLNTDIEDRKKAEEALQSNERDLSLIINTMPTLAWSARPDGSGEFFNQHYLDYVGLPLKSCRAGAGLPRFILKT